MIRLPSSLRATHPFVIAVGLVLCITAALHLSHRDTGYVRDEGIYFDASRSYAAWFDVLADSPSKALERKVRDRHFAPNHEHPAMMKMLGGLSARALGSTPAHDDVPAQPGLMPEGAAMRLPARALASLAAGLLFLVGFRRAGVLGGAVAAGTFILLPRVWFNAGLHTFDVPVAAAILMVVLAYRRAQTSWRWGLAAGVLLGFAIAVKHNALFVGPLLALHHGFNVVLDGLREQRPIRWRALVNWPLVSMAVLGPVVALALWPWLWTDPIARFEEYMTFHRLHSWYNMEFLGVNYNQPPMPIAYPWVMTFATVPLVVLVSAAIGLVLQARADVRAPVDTQTPGTFWAPRPARLPQRDAVLYGIFTLFPIALISLPGTPIFGGTKHWLTAYPFMALLCVEGWAHLWRAAKLGHTRSRWLQPLALVLLLLPGALSTRDTPSLGLSQYAPLVGGPRGAADLGLNRGFWGHAALGLVPADSPPTKLHLHDLHELSRRQYAREGRWPANVSPSGLSQADAALHFYEQHMLSGEIDVWNQMRTTAPSAVIELDDVPISARYDSRPSP